jgi:tetratricopeptide (TPR) repeat protein
MRQERRGQAWQAVPYQLLAMLGMLRLVNGDEAGAAIAFSDARARAPDTDDARAEVTRFEADGYLSGLKINEAAAVYETALAIKDDGLSRRSLAECRRRLGELDAATEHLTAARQLGYEEGRIRSIEARVLSDRGQPEEAERLALAAAESAETNDADSMYTLTYVRVMHALPGAAETLRRYVALMPNDPDLPALLDRPHPKGGVWRDALETPSTSAE